MTARRGCAFLTVLLALGSVLSAKGPTERIVIAGARLGTPIEITDPAIVDQFQVFSGPGTYTCSPRTDSCVEGTDGLIVDWKTGSVAEPPAGLERYEVSFFVNDARPSGAPNPPRLAYVVAYAYDADRSVGYVYLPGKDDRWHSLNVASLQRDVEGNWFRATRAWHDVFASLIAHRQAAFD